ncbi:hypothetical protein K9O30_11675 [Clostridium bowmanii]|uniref:hypothetical protein n=1 Tax=Clostridium bowmanii TaxID=132925 RepID=UPI001C0ABE0B|nr:hypothetical protein [Clostridium bowmanii]MBU3189882.1 hypothetical protein [Clostridium bowmanii]MCA1074366.1 hypothetical protein [Clostridium bowmanii]
MKLKLITRVLEMLSFIVGLAGCIMIFMKIELPTMMFPICTLLLVITSMSAFIKTRKLIKLAYPLFIIYFLLAMPIILDFIKNKILSFGFVALSFVIAIIYIYRELITSSKEKELSR